MHHFGARGLYDGGLLLGDRESGSFWLHLTGKCVHGPLRGKQLEGFPLRHLTAGQAETAYPNAEFVLSRLSLAQRVVARGQERTLQLLGGRLPPGFRLTMGEVDTRLPLMERGLAVWTDRAQRFYPLETIRTQGNALVDADFSAFVGSSTPAHEEKPVVVGIDPVSGMPFCLYTDATACNWHEETLVLESGGYVRGTVLYDARGTVQAAARPQQTITCWYVYSFTFPGGEIYAG